MLNIFSHPWTTKRIAPTASLPARPTNLAQAISGKTVKISGFGALSATQRQHLQAYGLMPGRTVQVIAQQPVTIILIEQTELAFESDVARQIWVEPS